MHYNYQHVPHTDLLTMDYEIITRLPDHQTHPTPLLFVHGGWHAAWSWDEYFLPYMARHGYIAHAMSLRGHGSTPNTKPLRATRIKDYAADVVEVARSIQPAPIIIGHSMGGIVVQHALADFHAPAGVLVASIPLNVFPTILSVMRGQPAGFLAMNLKLTLAPLVSTPQRTRWMFFSDSMPADQVSIYHQRMQDESYMVFMDAAIFARADPRKVKTPLLVIGAGKDNLFSRQQTEALAKAYHTTAHIFPNIAHDMMLEAEWQSVADFMLGWLSERGF